jgi:hypothetical protein
VRCLAIAVAAATFLLSSQAALATPADMAATHAYLRADYALARASEAMEPAVQDNVNRFSAKIGQECANAGAEAPQNEEAQRLSSEVAGALWSVGYHTVAAPIRAFARAVGRLHWSSRRLTQLARGYADSLSALATLPQPDLCGDVGAWKASGFRTIPARTLSFDRRSEGIQPHAVPQRLLAPFEQPADRAVARRIAGLEYELEGDEFTVGFEDWTDLLTTLGLHQ